MIENLPLYIQGEAEEHGSILEELSQLKHTKKPVYSANLIRYALMLRYSSLPAYKQLLTEFNLPSVSFLRKLTSGKIDALSSAKLLKSSGKISEDVILMFDEIYLQKCEEYEGGETTGADFSGNLYKGLECFMIVGLKSNVPFVIMSSPEKEIPGEWVKTEILRCLMKLKESGFNVRGIVCDNHASNVAAYKKLLSDYGNAPTDLFMTFRNSQIYLFFDTVHLMKNIRNNLLNRKRFLFPEFSFSSFQEEIHLSSCEVSWGLFHKIYEKDLSLTAHLRAAPKITPAVLHPGGVKQSVPVALAIFDETTIAAINRYFPERADASGFLSLINVWWKISNSKTLYNSNNPLGNAAKEGDRKPEFLRALASWLCEWDAEKIPLSEKFTLSSQTSLALQRTLMCHAALIEELLADIFKYVLTARFQSDPIERRYRQYRQMCGGRYLVSLKDINTSEKIIRIKCLVQEGSNIDDSVKVSEEDRRESTKLVNDFEELMQRDSLPLAL